MDRRSLLRLATASAGTLWLPRSAWSQPRLADNPFRLGVASGSPTHDSVLLWTRLLGDDAALAKDVTVRWEIAHDEAFRRIVASGQSPALSELAHSVHVEVGGLEPDRWYFYRFMAGGHSSPTGRTRTFPAADADAARLRLAYASCQRWDHGHYGAWRHMVDERLDAVVFLGDYIYEYPTGRDAVRPVTGGWCLTLDDYRRRYALHKGDADLQAMHAACPWFVTWDDHEVQNDYAGAIAGSAGPEVADFAARRAHAYQAFYEHMPLRASALTQAMAGLAKGAETRVYAQQRFGRLATLYLLDDRQYRDPQACTHGGARGSSTIEPADCAAWADPKRTLLGSAQEAWLDRALASGSRGWNVIGQQTLFGSRDYAPAGAKPRLWNDSWDGYPAARARMIESLRGHAVPGVVLLGGDVHENWVGHVKADYADSASVAIGVEFCGTSLTSRSGGNDRTAQRLANNPHFVYAEASRRGYGVCEFTPRQLTTTLRAVSDVTRRDTGIETLARFVVEAGRSRIERA